MDGARYNIDCDSTGVELLKSAVKDSEEKNNSLQILFKK